MEAGQPPPPVPPPPPGQTPPPAPPPPGQGPGGQPPAPGQLPPGQRPVGPSDGGLNVGLRIVGVIVGLIWALLGVALIIAFFDVVGAELCEDALADPSSFTFGEECYDGSSTQRIFDILFGLPAGILGVLTLPLAIYVAATGKRAKELLYVAVVALVLFGVALLIGG